jgi:hypothetical protein
MVNKTQRKDCENIKFHFFGIENIHVMRVWEQHLKSKSSQTNGR